MFQQWRAALSSAYLCATLPLTLTSRRIELATELRVGRQQLSRRHSRKCHKLSGAKKKNRSSKKKKWQCIKEQQVGKVGRVTPQQEKKKKKESARSGHCARVRAGVDGWRGTFNNSILGVLRIKQQLAIGMRIPVRTSCWRTQQQQIAITFAPTKAPTVFQLVAGRHWLAGS